MPHLANRIVKALFTLYLHNQGIAVQFLTERSSMKGIEMIMNRMNFKKASSICLALTMACFQMQPLAVMPVLAEEDLVLEDEILEAESETEVFEAEEVDSAESDEESASDEIADEEIIEEEAEYEEAEDSEMTEEAEEAEFDTAANVTVLSGSMSSKLSQLKQQFPAGRYWNHKASSSHAGDKQFTKSSDPCNNPEGTTNRPCNTHNVSSTPSSLKDARTGDYSCNYFDHGVQCNGYARLIFYKLHGKLASSYTIKKPSSVNEIKVGDFVQISGAKTSNHSLIATSVNTSRKTITGTDANNGASCKISWNSTFDFKDVSYIISPTNPVAGIDPGNDANTDDFAHNPSATKTYVLRFDTGADKAVATHNNITGYYTENVFLPANIVTRPGYVIGGWKIKLPSGQILKQEENKWKVGVGQANNGVSYSSESDSNGDAVFKPGNAFWADEGAQGATFTLIPQWEADPNYQAPTPPSNPTTPTQPADPANPFDDVKKGDWYYDWVVKSNAAGLMTGLNSTHFGPNDKMSRAMVATVLYRMAGSPNISDTQIFPDVPAGQWYSKAIKWANEKKVATGYENGKFGPDDNITREQLATMICRYQRNVAGKSTSDKASLDKFPDKKNVNDFARESVQYCVAKGIITGSHGHLLPVDNATRAECSKMLLVAKDAK